MAFEGAALDSAKLGILAGSVVSAIAGLTLLFIVGRKSVDDDPSADPSARSRTRPSGEA